MHPVTTAWYGAWRHDHLLREATVARAIRRARTAGAGGRR